MASEQKPLTTPAKTEDLPKIDLVAANKIDEKQLDETVEDTSPEKENINEKKIVFKEGNSSVLVAENNDKKPRTSDKTIIKEEDDDIRSKDSTLSDPLTIIQPEFDQNKKIDAPVNPVSIQTTDIKEVLELSGIGTTPENGKLKVKSIGKNSIAERSGVKVGDVVVAINGKEITDEPLEGKTINIETITVLRKGETTVIAFKAN